MLGLIFNEFLEFADVQRSGRARSLMGAVGRPADGGYEPLCRYEPDELLVLASLLAQDEAVTRADVLRRFGTRLFTRLVSLYPVFADKSRSVSAFLEKIEAVHAELRELHPPAELPSVRCHRLGDGRLEVEYSSEHELVDLAEGMIRGCIAHFGGDTLLERHDVAGAGCRAARFVVTEVVVMGTGASLQPTAPAASLRPRPGRLGLGQ